MHAAARSALGYARSHVAPSAHNLSIKNKEYLIAELNTKTPDWMQNYKTCLVQSYLENGFTRPMQRDSLDLDLSVCQFMPIYADICRNMPEYAEENAEICWAVELM